MTDRIEAIRALPGCGDHSCMWKTPTGMATNGGCRCYRSAMKAQRFVRAAHDLLSEVERLKAREAKTHLVLSNLGRATRGPSMARWDADEVFVALEACANLAALLADVDGEAG